MTVSNEAILSSFDLSGESLGELISDETVFINSNRTVVRKGVPSQFIGTLANQQIPAEVTLREGRLTTLTLIKRIRPTDNRVIYTARGAMSNVKFDISIKENDEKIDLVDKMLDLSNAFASKQYSREEFLSIIGNKNMRFAAINDSEEGLANYRGMSLFFEQQGTSEEQFELAASKFIELGAVKVNNSDRVVSQYRHEDGVPVVGFEMLRQDRSLNRTNTGFIDLVDSTMSSLLNYFKFATLVRATEKEIAETTGAKKTQAQARLENIVKEMNNFTRSLGNWGGVQSGFTSQPDGSLTKNGEWYTTNIPSGRVQLGSIESPVELDFWTTRSDKPAGASVIDTTAGVVVANGEEPF
jgi:hypothetical protein